MVNLINCNKSDFFNIVEKKDIVCFGAGDEFEKTCRLFPKIQDRIKAIVDQKRCGEKLFLHERVVPIIELEELDVNENSIFLITSIMYADEIVQKLDDIIDFSGVLTYVPYFFSNTPYKFEPKVSSYGKIPKVIHYCWFGGKKIPSIYQDNIETWKEKCPDYEIIRWDESNYDYTKNKYMYDAYKHEKWGFVPDYARLDIINTYGGIYLDTDVKLLKTFDDLLSYSLFCGFENDFNIAFGLGFGATYNNIILKEMISMYDNISFINEDGTLNQTSSPKYQTKVMKEFGFACNGLFQEKNGCVVFPREYFAPIDPYGLGEVLDCTYSIHQYAATWIDEKATKKKKRIIESVNYINNRMRK